MENVFKQIGEANCLSELAGFQYGSTNVEYIGWGRLKMEQAIKTINLIAGVEVIREEPYQEGWEETVVPGKYCIVYSDRHNSIPAISNEDLGFLEAIDKVAKERIMIRLNLHPALNERAVKACKSLGLVCSVDDHGILIDGRPKSLSVYKQIQLAYNEGRANISFDTTLINAPTVRTYSSQFGAAIGKKLRCLVEKGKITVHFKEADPKEVVMNELKEAVKKAAEYLTYNEISVICDQVVADYLSEAQPSINRLEGISYIGKGFTQGIPEYEEPLWKQAGFDNEQEYLDYEAKKKADIDAWTNPDFGTEYKPELPPGVEIVDRLKQHTISIIKEGMPADDEF